MTTLLGDEPDLLDVGLVYGRRWVARVQVGTDEAPYAPVSGDSVVLHVGTLALTGSRDGNVITFSATSAQVNAVTGRLARLVLVRAGAETEWRRGEVRWL